MSLEIYEELEQGSTEWLQARAGIITASVIGKLITPKTVKPASNETARDLVRHLAAERITGYVEPTFMSRDMERGTLDEPHARLAYEEHFAPVKEVGFMVREIDGARIGYSPDGLVGDDGLIEIKSRKQKIHLQHILDGEVPLENMAQIQCGLFVTERAWCDYISFSGGMKLWVKRVYPDPQWQAVIKEVALAFETVAKELIQGYEAKTEHLPDTERVEHYELEDII